MTEQSVNGEPTGSSDRWDLPIGGGEVTQLRIDMAFGLTIETYEEPRSDTSVRIECPFDFVVDGKRSRIEPADKGSFAPLLALHGSVVGEAQATSGGHLVLRFSGSEIRVPPHSDFEAWNVWWNVASRDQHLNLVAIPGGGVAQFGNGWGGPY